MSEEKKKKGPWNNCQVNHYTGYVELNQYIIDEAVPEKKIIRRCAFPGCITILNQSNVKQSPFCLHHQRVIEVFIRDEEPVYVYRYYKGIINKFKPPKIGDEPDEDEQ